MRLTTAERQAIMEEIQRFDPKARVYLFGSRADDDKRGGDIDLLIFPELLEDKNIPLLKVRLYERLGEQKIDIVLARDQSKPFVRLALSEAVEL